MSLVLKGWWAEPIVYIFISSRTGMDCTAGLGCAGARGPTAPRSRLNAAIQAASAAREKGTREFLH